MEYNMPCPILSPLDIHGERMARWKILITDGLKPEGQAIF